MHRKGDFIFPVDVLVKFEDGSTTTEHWDGRDRWVRYTYDRKSKVASAQIDPGNQVMLDRNFFNNSYVVQGDNRAVHKLKICGFSPANGFRSSWPGYPNRKSKELDACRQQ